MKPVFARITRPIAVAVLLTALGACALPRPGPTKGEILNAEFEESSGTQIVEVDERINRIVAVSPSSSLPASFRKAGAAAPDRIRPGDTLSFTVYENVADGVLSRGKSGASRLQELQVDEGGFVFIPYAGRIRAAGNSPERLRQIITEKLATLTPEPQVLVQRAAGDDATVSILGDGIRSQGVYPIERSSRRLMEMLATAGGVTAPAEVVRITVLRNQSKGELWFEDVYDHPEYDIALRAGDRILVQRDPRGFTIFGATGKQTNELFGSRQPSALEAVAQVGGLRTRDADPTGLFVVRRQDADLTNRVLGRNEVSEEVSVIYVLDLTKPNGLPLARDFDIRDGDTIYVTEAPAVQWRKSLDIIRNTTATAAAVERVSTSN
ncbi:polysaccharide biosynthesis/export family protein [Marimonas sp. MJW-29]|uniref:Polysaccharide biosynthesis/export family protein n=1 Tax=Sulfitobacter sediminis TaxID=3234186 RepID=A0ABV3RN39_9RHOB